jgi:caa(3)-type oxidase subunit IV
MKEHTGLETHGRHPTPAIFLAVYIALITFTLLTFGASKLSHTVALYAGLAIAAVKSALVAAYFMNLKYDARFLRYIFIFAIGLVLWLILMLRPDFYAR